jgi:hypothetical protein
VHVGGNQTREKKTKVSMVRRIEKNEVGTGVSAKRSGNEKRKRNTGVFMVGKEIEKNKVECDGI